MSLMNINSDITQDSKKRIYTHCEKTGKELGLVKFRAKVYFKKDDKYEFITIREIFTGNSQIFLSLLEDWNSQDNWLYVPVRKEA